MELKSLHRIGRGGAFGGALALLLACPAQAQDVGTYPNHTIQMIIPFAPAGASDFVARILQPGLSRLLGQQIVIENRAGAAGMIGTEVAARAAPDGYTVFLGNVGTVCINPTLYAEMKVKPDKDFAPVSLVAETPGVLIARPDFPASNVKELVDYAKARPGKINFASPGSGSLNRLEMEVFRGEAGLDMVHVPYKGGGVSVQAVMTGQVQLTFENPATALPLIASGGVRALAVTSETRSPHLPDVPTMIESGVAGFATVSFFGLVVKAGTPAGIVARLNDAVNRSLAAEAAQATLRQLSLEVGPGTPEEFAAYLARERGRWEEIARLAHVEVE
jgi:tripartite-type tricarboxylate transporter receptor subunit TctC